MGRLQKWPKHKQFDLFIKQCVTTVDRGTEKCIEFKAPPASMSATPRMLHSVSNTAKLCERFSLPPTVVVWRPDVQFKSVLPHDDRASLRPCCPFCRSNAHVVFMEWAPPRNFVGDSVASSGVVVGTKEMCTKCRATRQEQKRDGMATNQLQSYIFRNYDERCIAAYLADPNLAFVGLAFPLQMSHRSAATKHLVGHCYAMCTTAGSSNAEALSNVYREQFNREAMLSQTTMLMCVKVMSLTPVTETLLSRDAKTAKARWSDINDALQPPDVKLQDFGSEMYPSADAIRDMVLTTSDAKRILDEMYALHCKMTTYKIGIDIHLHDSSVHDKYRYFWSVCMSWAATITGCYVKYAIFPAERLQTV